MPTQIASKSAKRRSRPAPTDLSALTLRKRLTQFVCAQNFAFFLGQNCPKNLDSTSARCYIDKAERKTLCDNLIIQSDVFLKQNVWKLNVEYCATVNYVILCFGKAFLHLWACAKFCANHFAESVPETAVHNAIARKSGGEVLPSEKERLI